MKRLLLEIQVGLLVIVGVALVLAMGYLAYTGMSSILSAVTRESRPDVKLNLIRMLATDLEKAENSVRLYAYSREDKDLKPYYSLITGVESQLEELSEAGKGSPEFSANLDTISDLIGQKVLIWNEMLPLYTVRQAEIYLDTISQELENKIVADSIRKNRSFLKKIFKRHPKTELDEQKMVRNIEQAKTEDSQKSDEIRNKEMRLAEANRRLTQQFYVMVERMEEKEYNRRQQRAKEADLMAEETYKWIGWFSGSATLSLLLVIFVITRYIRKSHKYQLALVKARTEAENLAKAKEMFVANVSHELRTPMNVISGFLDQLLKRPQDEENGNTLRIIKTSSDHLVRIVNDILDFSKLESGKMSLEPVHFNAREVFGEIDLLFRKATQEKNINLTVDVDSKVPEYLYGDAIRLKQILINLAGNAIKFTDEGGVTIAVKAENQVASHLDLKITVTDTGIGIAQEKLDIIFDDFTQAESGTTQRFGGTGLGLSIVRKMVELHGGTVRVSSKLNEGTTFTCKLPYKKGKKEEVKVTDLRSFVVPEALKGVRILVVDDEEYNRKLVVTILKKWELECGEAGTGEKALEVLGNEKYDLVLMDNRMPGMDGLETSRRITAMKKKGSGRPVIVSFTAASVSDEQRKVYKKAGIGHYLSKPFTERELLDLLLDVRDIDPGSVEYRDEPVPEKTGTDGARIDLNQLYRVAGDDEAFVIEMLEKFVESFDSGYEKMVEGIDRQEYKEAGDAAHKLAAPCRHIGADNLLSILKEIEQEAEMDPPASDLKEKAEKASREYLAVRQEVMDHLNGRK